MRDRYVPVERDGTVRESQPSSQFMLQRLLESRSDLGIPSDDGHDHDVNMYITQLLCAYGDPRYCLRVAGYLSTYDSTVFERAQKSRSHRFRYTVYKANADYMLMAIGVFQNPEGRSTEGRPALLRRDEETFVGRGKAYYDFASAYSERVFGSTSGVSDVLGKLSAGFEQYVRLLAHLRGEYFEFASSLSEGEIYHLQRSADAEGLEALRDEFLDLYSAWRQDPTPEARARLLDALARIQRVDPDFDADLLQ